MDVVDLLNDRSTCRACSRLVPWSDDFCSECRRICVGVALDPALEGLEALPERVAS